jgi:peptidoglycan hydrolase CwlO-like protein
MNNTEYDLLTKDKLLSMLEEAESEIDRLEDEVQELQSDIDGMVYPEDTCGCLG